MIQIPCSWSQIKSYITSKDLEISFIDKSRKYEVWACEESVIYIANIPKSDPASEDQTDFENNYKTNANKSVHPKDTDKKTYVRAESRPLGFATCFTMAGDDVVNTKIGEGKIIKWDFSNADDDITAPTGFKRKRMEFQFIDNIHVKEGTFYFFGAPFGCYADFYVVCPNGQVYLDNNGQQVTATEDTPIVHYVVKHYLNGDCPMGDELNTEAASEAIPSNYKFWCEVTTPDTDSSSKGYASLEIYRKRTVVL